MVVIEITVYITLCTQESLCTQYIPVAIEEVGPCKEWLAGTVSQATIQFDS